MPKEKYDLTFEDAKPNDEIYKEGITVVTRTIPKPPPLIFEEGNVDLDLEVAEHDKRLAEAKKNGTFRE